MKKNIIIAVLAIAFITSFSWNWIARAQRDKVAETVEEINTYLGDGATFSGVSGSDGTFYLIFSGPNNQSPPTLGTLTISNIDENDIDFVIN
jgi:hypothetical protein